MNEDRQFRSFGPDRFVVLHFDWSNIGKRFGSEPKNEPNEKVEEIVIRLLSIVGEFRSSARRIGTPIDGAPLRDVIRGLRIESLGEDPRDLLRTTDATETYLRESLYWELLEESGIILSAVADRPRLNATEIWRESLLILETRLGFR